MATKPLYCLSKTTTNINNNSYVLNAYFVSRAVLSTSHTLAIDKIVLLFPWRNKLRLIEIK